MSTKKIVHTSALPKRSLAPKLTTTISLPEKSLIKKRLLKKTDSTKISPTIGCELIEEELHKRSERYQSLFNSIDEGFCIIEVLFKKTGKAYDHRILEANAAFTKHTGVKNPIGKMASELVPGGEQFFNNIYGQVVTTGKSQRFEQGSEVMERWFSVFVSRVGQVSENTVAVVFTDITKSKLNETRVQQSEMRFQGFMAASSDVMYRMSSDWTELLELNGKNIVPDTKKTTTTFMNKHVHKDDEKRVLVAINKAIKNKSTLEIEYRANLIDGKLGWAYSRAVPILNNKGEIAEWFGTETVITAKKEAGETLERYRDLFNTMDQGCCVIEIVFNKKNKPVDYRFLEVNRTFEKQTGMKNVVGKLISELAPNLEKYWFERYATVARTGVSQHYISKIQGLDGRWLDIYAYSTGEKGSAQVCVLFSDISARKAVEELISASEIRYRRLFESAKDGILILDEKTAVITDVNPYLCNLLGYTHADFIGKELWQLGFFKDRRESRVAMKELKDKKYIRYEDLPLKTRVGELIDVEFVSNVYGEGNSVVIQCNIRDITARKIVQEELLQSKAEAQTSKENLYNLFMGAPAIIAVMSGPNLVFELANLPYRKLVGIDRPLEGMPLLAAIPDIEPELKEIINNVATKGERFVNSEFPIKLDWDSTGNAYTKYLDLTYEPLFNVKKKPYGVMCFGYDISEQVESRKKLEEAARMKEEFLSMASHEMRTPVTSIKGYAQILESQFKKDGDEASFKMVSKLVEQVDNLSSLIKDLFDDSKVKEGKLDIHPNYFDFNALVSEVIEEMQHTTKQHTITLKLTDIPKIYADKERLRQVIVNLLTNAIKYSPEATSINVKTTRSGNSVSLSVKDYGLGISKEAQSKIFTRFYREKNEVLDTYPGLGLGLYIAADIVQKHGGSIEVKSSKGKGSVFTTTLPIKNKSI